MLDIESISPSNIHDLLQPVTEIFGGADSYVYHLDQFAIHHYKDHVDIPLFEMYYEATCNAVKILDGLFSIPQINELISVAVNPILKWFVSRTGSIVSISDWIEGESGREMANDYHKKKYLSIIPILNNRLETECRPMGAEIISMNTKYHFPWFKHAECVITDVGNGLRYLRL